MRGTFIMLLKLGGNFASLITLNNNFEHNGTFLIVFLLPAYP